MPKHITKPSGVTPPTVAEMDAAAKKVGLKNYPDDLVRDLHDYAHGGEIVPPSAYLPQAREEARKVISDPGFKNEQKLPLKDLEAELTSNALWNHRSMGDFISGVDLSWFPGETPLEQSMNMLKLLEQINRNSAHQEQKDRKFDRNDARQISQVQRDVDRLSPEERKMLQPKKKGIKTPFKLDLGRKQEDPSGKEATQSDKPGNAKSKDGDKGTSDPKGSKSGKGKPGEGETSGAGGNKPGEKQGTQVSKNADGPKSGSQPGDKQDAEKQVVRPKESQIEKKTGGSSAQEQNSEPPHQSESKKDTPKSAAKGNKDKQSSASKSRQKSSGEQQKTERSAPQEQGPEQSDDKEKPEQSCCAGGENGEEHSQECQQSSPGGGSQQSEDQPADGQPSQGQGGSSSQSDDESDKSDSAQSESDAENVEESPSDSDETASEGEETTSEDEETPSEDGDNGKQGEEQEEETDSEGSSANGGRSDQIDEREPDSENAQDGGEGSGTSHNRLTRRDISQDTDRMELAEGLLPGGKLKMMLDMSRNLDMFESIRISKRQGTMPDPEGEDVRRRRMKDISEFGRIVPAELSVRPVSRSLFRYRLVTHKCMIRERIKHYMRKQIIFILLDGSGSMGGDRHWRASGVVMNRLKAVLTGDAELWLSVFDTKLTKVHHAATEEEAQDVIAKFMAGNYTGGGTNIGASVLAAHGFIQKLMESRDDLERPQIWILSDEDQSIKNITPAQVEGTKVNAMIFTKSNQSLVDFAKATGGLAFENA